MEIEFPRPTEDLGRIAAQTAKQVIFQKVREAERENVYARVQPARRRSRQRDGEAVRERRHHHRARPRRGQLPRKEQSRAENYTVGDRVRAVIRGVNRSAKGPQIVLSRTDPALLIKLFEQEVPEIYDGTVMIRGAVREAGDRAKVAVYSRERDVDPVGACVGMKGTRVQSIIRELRGEKIDIVEWSEDPIVFVTNAISPAKVQRVSIVDDAEKVMEVVVEDKQLSLAIGKKGQNVRLAAKLTGWKIDIKSEEEKRREVETQLGALEVGDPPATKKPAGCEAPPRSSRRTDVVAAEATCGRPTRTSRRKQTEARRDRGCREPTTRDRGQQADADMQEIARRNVRTSRTKELNGNSPDLQSRGAAEHLEPGSDGAAQARSRHRGEERVEHDRRGRRAGVRRRAWRGSADSTCRRTPRSPTRRPRSRERSPPASRRSRPSRRPVAAAAAARQVGQAARHRATASPRPHRRLRRKRFSCLRPRRPLKSSSRRSRSRSVAAPAAEPSPEPELAPAPARRSRRTAVDRRAGADRHLRLRNQRAAAAGCGRGTPPAPATRRAAGPAPTAASSRRRSGCASKIRRTGQAPPAPPRRPMLVRPPAPAPSTASQAPTGNLSRPAAPRPGAPGAAGAAAAAAPGGRHAAASRIADGRSAAAARRSRCVRRRRRVPACRAVSSADAPSAAAASGPVVARRDSGPRVPAPAPMQAPPPPVTRTITLAEGMTVADLADQARRQGEGRPEEADGSPHDDDDQQHARRRDRGDDRARVRRRREDADLRRGDAAGRSGGHRSGRSRHPRARSSPSWVTSTTARRRCSTRSARRASPSAKPAASRSTSAPTR